MEARCLPKHSVLTTHPICSLLLINCFWLLIVFKLTLYFSQEITRLSMMASQKSNVSSVFFYDHQTRISVDSPNNQNNANNSNKTDWLQQLELEYSSSRHGHGNDSSFSSNHQQGIIVIRANVTAQNEELLLRSNESSDEGRLIHCDLVRGRRIVVTYGSHAPYIESAKKACQASVKVPGIDACLVITPQFLDVAFRRQNADILQYQRGGGYWLWKPYMLLRLLLAIDNDDVLLYLDADKMLINSLEEHVCLQAQVGQDVVVFYQFYVEYPWTKADAYLIMNVEALMPRVNETMQIYGAYVMLRKSLFSIRFVAEWLTYSQDDRVNADRASQLRHDALTFRENRHDQTVLSLLAKKWNIPNWPSPELHFNHIQSGLDDFNKQFFTYNSLDLESLSKERGGNQNFTIPKRPIISTLI